MISQKTPLVCFKFGSDEIIGINMIYVSSRGDNLMKTARKRVSEIFISKTSVASIIKLCIVFIYS